MKLRLSAILVLFFLMAGIGLAQQSAYQPGKIVSIQKRESPSPTGGSDAPMKASEKVYDLTIETGGKTYKAVYKAHSDLEPTWSEGKDVEVQVKGKAMYVKRSTDKHPAKLAIVRSN
jgi:hypothetical protein